MSVFCESGVIISGIEERRAGDRSPLRQNDD